MTTEEEKKNWWQRLDAQFRLTLIAGGFVIAAALCAGICTLVVPFIELILYNSQTEIPHEVYTKYELTTRGALETIWAIIPTDEVRYRVASGTCLDVYELDGTRQGQILPTDGNFPGALDIFVQTNISIVIHNIQLTVTDFAPLTSQNSLNLISNYGGGTGGKRSDRGFVKKERLDYQLISPYPNTYNLMNTEYELPENEAVSFWAPIYIAEPGTYTYELHLNVITLSNITVNPSYGSSSEEFRWVFVKDIDPQDIVVSPQGSIYFELCK